MQTIYTDYHHTVYKICRKYAWDVDDDIHSIFLKVFEKLHENKFSARGSLEGWIRRIAINYLIDKFRKPKIHMVPITDIPDCINESDDPIFTLPSTEIKRLMEFLTPAYKEVFKLYYFYKLPHIEIASKLGIHEGSSKSNLHRAKKQFIKLYTEQYGRRNSN